MLIVQTATDGQGKRLTTTTAIQRSQVFHQIVDYTPALIRTYTSVQNTAESSIEEFFLAHLNHHCNPNVVVDTARMELRAIRDISPGEDLTFFYPSTEWEMAEPFACLCGDNKCLKTISGAKDISLNVLGNYFINRHIGIMALEHLLGAEPVLRPVAA
ncbi:MAG: SET domain-containing protein [Phormidesmis sp. RL_2_1]|nr:SET domain-containing protein [Phormidesmis sp. RL_2_1]